MQCYKCGVELSEKDFCTACGADVARYKKIIYTSNRLYNQGLEKAKVRDLTGAINDLRQSLKFNKLNTQARNLLGLIYYELGDVVEALTEWVISKNYQDSKNLATDYIGMMQANQASLEVINQAIVKYNQTLNYCHQDSLDMAKIQVKKVIKLNPKFYKGHLLLTLLYLHDQEYNKALKEVEICRKIDTGNLIANRYYKEISEALGLDDNKPAKKVQQTAPVDDYWLNQGPPLAALPEPGNSSILSTIVYILLGLVVGLAIGWFLLGPIRVRMNKAGVEEEMTQVRDQLSAKSAELEELTQSNDSLNAEINNLNALVAEYEQGAGTNEAVNNLMYAAIEYSKGEARDPMVIADYIGKIDPEYVMNEASEAYVSLYNTVKGTVGNTVATNYYNTGMEAYRNADYPTAIENLNNAIFYDPSNSEALYALAVCYVENGDVVKAKECFTQVIALFPDTERAAKAQNYIDSLGDI